MGSEIISRPYKNEKLALQELEYYVYHYDIRQDTLPKLIDPALVETFIRKLLSSDLPGVDPTRRIVELADFYQIQGLAPDFISLLNRKESTQDAFLISMTLTEGLAYIGDEGHRAWGKNYYHYLIKHPLSAHHISAMTNCYAAYAPEDPGDAITSRMNEIIAELKHQSESNPMAGVELREIQDIRNNTLPRIQKAAALKEQIKSIRQTPLRLDNLVGIYLNLDPRYREYLDLWAVRMLLIEWKNQGASEILQAFRRALVIIDASSNTDEAKASLRATCLRAIDFLGGELSPEESQETKAIAPNLAGRLTLDE